MKATSEDEERSTKELRVKWPPVRVFDGMRRVAQKNRRSLRAEIVVACEKHIAAEEGKP